MATMFNCKVRNKTDCFHSLDNRDFLNSSICLLLGYLRRNASFATLQPRQTSKELMLSFVDIKSKMKYRPLSGLFILVSTYKGDNQYNGKLNTSYSLFIKPFTDKGVL